MVAKQDIVDLVRKISAPLDPALVLAIIEQESGFIQYAVRYEPAFLVKYVPKNLSVTETHMRAVSWGLMQVMGQSARECGYNGPLAQLCDPETGIRVGCTLFGRKLAKANSSVHQGLLYWNGGENLKYPDEVMARIAQFV